MYNSSLEFQNKCYICEFQYDDSQSVNSTKNNNDCKSEFQYIFFSSINLLVSESVLSQINSFLEKNIPKRNIIITIKDNKLKSISSMTNNRDTFLNQCYVKNLSILCIENTISTHNTFKNNFTFKLPQKHLKLYSKL